MTKINQFEIDIRMNESRIGKLKDCKRYWRSLLRWDYVNDCDKDIEELEIEVRQMRKQNLQMQIENEWDGVFTFMQVSNDEEINKCINRIDKLENELAVLY